MWRLRLSGALWLMLWWVADHAGLSDGWMLELRCSIGTDDSPGSCSGSRGTAHSSADNHVQSGSV